MGPSDSPLAFMSAVPPEEFSDRCRPLPPTDTWDLPVLVFEVSIHAPGLRLRRAPNRLACNDLWGVAFHSTYSVGARETLVFGVLCPGLGVPLPLPHPRCCHRRRTTQGQRIWLGFRCKTLSFSTSNRFILAFSGRAAFECSVFKRFEHVFAGRTRARQCVSPAGTHNLAWLAPQVPRDLQTIDDPVRSSRPTAARAAEFF